MDDSFSKIRNIRYDFFVLISSKQQKGESVERFYGRLTEQAQNCSLGNYPYQRYIHSLYAGTRRPKRIVERNRLTYKSSRGGKQKEMGAQNQQKINQNLNTIAHSVNDVNKFQSRNLNANYQPARKDFTRYPTVPQI